jgi:WD40 repeat protein
MKISQTVLLLFALVGCQPSANTPDEKVKDPSPKVTDPAPEIVDPAIELRDVVGQTKPGDQIRIFEGHAGHVHSVDFSPNSNRLVSGGNDRTVRTWDLMTGQELKRLEGHFEQVMGVGFCSDSTRVASASYDMTARIWDATNGEPIKILSGHSSKIYSMASSSNGPWIATGGRDDQLVRIWNSQTGEIAFEERQEHYVRYLSFSSDGRHLAICTNYWGFRDRTERTGMVRVLTVPEGKEIMSIPIRGSRISFSRDGTLLALADRVLEVPSGRSIILIEEEDVNLHCISPDGGYVAGLNKSQNNEIVIWDCDTRERVSVLKGHTAPVTNIRYSTDGKLLVSSSYDGTLRLWNVTFLKSSQ